MFPPAGAGAVDAHGHEVQMGTNCLGPYLLYQLLAPLLAATAAAGGGGVTGGVRVVWAASIAVQMLAPGPGGVVLDGEGAPRDVGVRWNYGQSKVGNVFFAREFAKGTARTGVVHVAINPGNLATELQRHWTGLDSWVTVSFLFERVQVHELSDDGY